MFNVTETQKIGELNRNVMKLLNKNMELSALVDTIVLKRAVDGTDDD